MYLIRRCSLSVRPEDPVDVPLVALERVQALQDRRLRDEVFALRITNKSLLRPDTQLSGYEVLHLGVYLGSHWV
jgi:hypothetical protein